MDYQIAVREDKGLEVGTPPPLIQGEKGVDRLVFTLPDPYRGMALDDFSFTANLESAAGCHKLAAARSERVEGAVRCVLELDCSLEGLRDEVLLSLEGRDGQRVLATRKTISEWSGEQAAQLTEQAMALATPDEVGAYLHGQVKA